MSRRSDPVPGAGCDVKRKLYPGGDREHDGERHRCQQRCKLARLDQLVRYGRATDYALGDFEWTASTSSVAGYNVYRSAVSGGPYAIVNSALITTTQFTDPTVQAGGTYYYVVTSVDSTGVNSGYSNEVSATIP